MLILKVFKSSTHANTALIYIGSVKEARQLAIDKIRQFIEGNTAILAEWSEVDKSELGSMIDTTNNHDTPY
jgi:hypothetical protein